MIGEMTAQKGDLQQKNAIEIAAIDDDSPDDEQQNLQQRPARSPDRCDPSRITHTLADMIRTRIFAIGCGYEDANDLDPALRFGLQARLRAIANTSGCLCSNRL